MSSIFSAICSMGTPRIAQDARVAVNEGMVADGTSRYCRSLINRDCSRVARSADTSTAFLSRCGQGWQRVSFSIQFKLAVLLMAPLIH